MFDAIEANYASSVRLLTTARSARFNGHATLFLATQTQQPGQDVSVTLVDTMRYGAFSNVTLPLAVCRVHGQPLSACAAELVINVTTTSAINAVKLRLNIRFTPPFAMRQHPVNPLNNAEDGAGIPRIY